MDLAHTRIVLATLAQVDRHHRYHCNALIVIIVIIDCYHRHRWSSSSSSLIGIIVIIDRHHPHPHAQNPTPWLQEITIMLIKDISFSSTPPHLHGSFPCRLTANISFYFKINDLFLVTTICCIAYCSYDNKEYLPYQNPIVTLQHWWWKIMKLSMMK